MKKRNKVTSQDKLMHSPSISIPNSLFVTASVGVHKNGVQCSQNEDVLALVGASLVRVVLHHKHPVDVDPDIFGRFDHALLNLHAL